MSCWSSSRFLLVCTLGDSLTRGGEAPHRSQRKQEAEAGTGGPERLSSESDRQLARAVRLRGVTRSAIAVGDQNSSITN